MKKKIDYELMADGKIKQDEVHRDLDWFFDEEIRKKHKRILQYKYSQFGYFIVKVGKRKRDMAKIDKAIRKYA